LGSSKKEQQEAMAKNKQKDTCLACNKAFTKSDASIQCAICALWVHHKPCSLVSDDGFKFLSEQVQATGSAYWACRSCMSYSQSFTRKVKEVEKKLEEVQKGLQDNTKGLERVDKNVEELRKEVGEVKNQTRMDTSKFLTAEEYREREARRSNIVMHRVKESAAETATERREADMSECSVIFREAGVANEAKEIKTCRRIGERGEVPRPLIVVMKKEAAKNAILEAAKNLRNTPHSDVSIVPDLTPQQRQEEVDLGGEAERRNREELSEDDRQKNLSWQVVGQRGAKRLIKTFTRQQQEWQQRGAGRPARGRGRIPTVPQPVGRRPDLNNGPAIPRLEMLPDTQNRKRGREYRPAVREKNNSATVDSGEEMEEEEEDEETTSPASKR
jgi:hypothetical protein